MTTTTRSFPFQFLVIFFTIIIISTVCKLDAAGLSNSGRLSGDLRYKRRSDDTHSVPTEEAGGESEEGSPGVGPTTHAVTGKATPCTKKPLPTDAQPDFHWSYEKDGELEWPKHYPKCGGSRQSPIDINRKYVTLDRNFKEIVFYTRGTPGHPNGTMKAHLTNNGHSAAVTSADKLKMVRGDSEETYTMIGIHFHWGRDADEGSEHRIDGKSFPLEMHMVFFDAAQYDTFSDALAGNDSLLVYGILFEISEDDNDKLAPIVNALPRASRVDNTEGVPIEGLDINKLLPGQYETRFYTYQGSLTTPPCSENVIWIIGDHKQTISLKQLEEFRKLPANPSSDNSRGKIDFNWRSPQSLNQRKVLVTFPVEDEISMGRVGGDAASSLKQSTVVCVGLMVLIRLFLMRC